MLTIVLVMAYLGGFSFILGLIPVQWEVRPTLEALGFDATETKKKRKGPLFFLRKIALINKPICSGGFRRRMAKDLTIAHVNLTPEEFIFIKEVGIVLVLILTYPTISPDMITMWAAFGFVGGYMIPEFWLKGRIKRVKYVIIKELPDAIDLLGLCVNAGLDFMLSLKWVVEKSQPSVMIDELNTVLQEINVGKTRRDAIKDLALRYELPDLSTFARTLIQADKMGTSMTEALNILSEDMRIARYRRGGTDRA